MIEKSDLRYLKHNEESLTSYKIYGIIILYINDIIGDKPMPKTYNKYPYNISAAISPKLKDLLTDEINISRRGTSEIIREALFEYFGEEEDEEYTIIGINHS